jgi:hypothetical protein
MPIKELLALVRPPKDPIDTQGDWGSVEIVVETVYPSDFKELISRYGSGRFFFDGHLEVFNPLTIAGLTRIKTVQKQFKAGREGGSGWSLPIHPEKGGLLPWGWDENGNRYAWLTKGKPDQWPVVFLGHGCEGKPLQFPTDITGFLAGYATDRFKQLLQPGEPFTDEVRTFMPGRNQQEVARPGGTL